jgi:hypothetical protein
VDEFWKTAYDGYYRSEVDLIRARGKVLSESIVEERLRRSLCERSSGPSHVEDGGGDAQRPVIRLDRSSADTDGPSSLGSSVVGSESVPGLGPMDTRVAPGYPSQT